MMSLRSIVISRLTLSTGHARVSATCCARVFVSQALLSHHCRQEIVTSARFTDGGKPSGDNSTAEFVEFILRPLYKPLYVIGASGSEKEEVDQFSRRLYSCPRGLRTIQSDVRQDHDDFVAVDVGCPS
jgi:hypothetical protein